jgi:hypothetical protein
MRRKRILAAFILQCSEGCATMIRFRPISARPPEKGPRLATSQAGIAAGAMSPKTN